LDVIAISLIIRTVFENFTQSQINSNTSKSYRVYNSRTHIMDESMHIKFDEFEGFEKNQT